jgi:hypothetical protein
LLDFILRSTIVAVENWLLVVITPVLALVAGFVGWELRERTSRRRVQHRVVDALLSELDETARTLDLFSQGPIKNTPQGWEEYVRQIAGYQHGGVVFDAMRPELGVLPKQALKSVVAFHARLRSLHGAAEVIARKQRMDMVGADINRLRDESRALVQKARDTSSDLTPLAAK